MPLPNDPVLDVLDSDKIRMLCQQARYESVTKRERMQKERTELWMRLHQIQEECRALGAACVAVDPAWKAKQGVER